MKSEQIISWELFFTKLQDFIQYRPACFLSSIQFSSVQFSRSIVSDSLWLHVFPVLMATYQVLERKMSVSHSVSSMIMATLWSLPGSSVHGILQARRLDWVASPFSRGSSWPRGWTWVSHIAGRFFTVWATREALWSAYGVPSPVRGFRSMIQSKTPKGLW